MRCNNKWSETKSKFRNYILVIQIKLAHVAFCMSLWCKMFSPKQNIDNPLLGDLTGDRFLWKHNFNAAGYSDVSENKFIWISIEYIETHSV